MTDREGLIRLAAEIRQELVNLTRIAAAVAETWRKRETVNPEERQVYVNSTALELHNFYTAAERIFEYVAGDLNGALPQSRDWHLRLLRTMAMEVPGVRPAVLSQDMVERLSDYLRFRHVVRNIYGFQLDEERIDPLAAAVEGTASELARQVEELAAYLEEMAHRLSE